MGLGVQGQHGPRTGTLSPLQHQVRGCCFAKWHLCPVASPEQGWECPYVLPHEVQRKPCWDPCSSIIQLPSHHLTTPQAQESTRKAHGPRLGAAPLARHCTMGTITPWLGGSVGNSSHPEGWPHWLTTPLSPQTLKIVRTAELSPFIVFIAPTDKAEQVGGRVPRLSHPLARLAYPWQGGKEPVAAAQGSLPALHQLPSVCFDFCGPGEQGNFLTPDFRNGNWRFLQP